MGHREDIRAFLENLTVEGEVIDWGSGSKPVKHYVNGGAIFHCIDKNPLVGPDIIVDMTDPLNVVMADHAFCMEVLEHVEDPRAVINNIYNNLKEGGKLYLSVPFLYPEHGDEDFWRFTKQGLRLLHSEFSEVKITDIDQGFLVEAIK